MIHTTSHLMILLIILNFIVIAGFTAGKIFFDKERNAQYASSYTVFLAFLFGLYLFLLLLLIIAEIFLGYIINSLLMILLLIFPFIIGHFSKYEKAGFWMNIQIIALIISLLVFNSAHKDIKSRLSIMNDSIIESQQSSLMPYEK